MKHPSAGNNNTNNPRGGRQRQSYGNKGIKAARDQKRRERAYARGATRPTESRRA